MFVSLVFGGGEGGGCRVGDGAESVKEEVQQAGGEVAVSRIAAGLLSASFLSRPCAFLASYSSASSSPALALRRK